MEITVESMTGRKTKLTNVNPMETVRGLKTRLWKLEGVPVSQQSLVFRNQALDDDRTLADYQITNGAIVKLILITRAGPINRRVEPAARKVDFSGNNAASCSRNTNSPCSPSINESQRHLSESNSGSSSTRRYTRQQMRQVQMATASIVGKNNYSARITGEPLSSDLEHQSSSSLLDLTFTHERQIASARRADENLRTMQRMRELRRSIERLNLEKSQLHGQRQSQQRNSTSGNGVSTIPEAGPSRCRRPTGGNSTTALLSNNASSNGPRSRGSTQLAVTPNDRLTAAAAAAAARAAYAADDTSAKESSAGETEIEDAVYCHQLSSNAAPSVASKQTILSSPGGAGKARNQTSNQNQLMPPPGFKSKHQLYRNIRRSSCSDVDVESSAVWSSDADVDAVLNNDRSREELFTADDWSLDDEDWDATDGRQDDVQKIIIPMDSSDDYEDASGDYEHRDDDTGLPTTQNRNSNSAHEAGAAETVSIGGLLSRSGGGQDVSSDPSELSSGVLVCELGMALNSRRMKVKRKSYHTPRHTNKRPQAMGIAPISRGAAGAAVDETDDQSPLESPVKYGGMMENRTFPFRYLHYNGGYYRDHHHLHAGYVPANSPFCGAAASRGWHRGRPRSKQRLSIGTLTSTSAMNDQNAIQLSTANNQQSTTGDSSSDEREDTSRRDSQVNIGASPSNSIAPLPSIGARSTGHGHKPPQSSQSQQRCNACACRLSIATTFQCRCGKTVCLRHRHADLHACTLLAAAPISDKK